MSTPNIITLPQSYNSSSFPRVFVRTHKIAQQEVDGIIIPEHEMKMADVATIVAVGEGSTLKVGDEVMFHKIDRSSDSVLDTVSIDGEVLDVLFEREIWSVNDEPFTQIFVKPVSHIEVSDGEIVVPENMRGFTRKGIVHSAPPHYMLKAGDVVEYRSSHMGLIPTANVNGELFDVLHETDVYVVNGEAAPYRMLVKVNLSAQKIKRTTAESGLILSELFRFMLYNLQYAEVISIGAEAQKMYPNVQQGDTVILHHSIESQDYRFVKLDTKVVEGQVVATHLHCIINCWREKTSELFGKLIWQQRTNKIIDIVPFHNNTFLEWNFSMVDNTLQANSDLVTSDYDLSKYNDLDNLKNAVKQMRAEAADKSLRKTKGIQFAISGTNPELDYEKWFDLQKEFEAIQKEEMRVAQYLRRDHLISCKAFSPKMIPSHVITYYEEVYPINLLGKKFLIAYPDFIVAQTAPNMATTSQNFFPLNGNVLVRPIAEERSADDIIIPDTAKEKPIKGEIMAIGEHPSIVKGDVVLYRQNTGYDQKLEDGDFLILREGDLLAVMK